MEPTQASGKDLVPRKVTCFELSGRFVAAIIKNNRRSHALSAVTEYGGHIWTLDPVMLETFIEWLDPHGPHAFGDQFSNRIVHHRRDNAGSQPKALSQVGGDVEFTSADVDLALGRLMKGNYARIKPMNECPEAYQVQRALRGNV